MKYQVNYRKVPFLFLLCTLGLVGCNQSSNQDKSNQSSTESSDASSQNTTADAKNNNLESGNMFYIVRDVADVQANTGRYFQQVQQSQNELQQALQSKSQPAIKNTVDALNQQLTQMNSSLQSLNLKSKEVDRIRQQMISANQQVLDSALLTGKTDLNQINLDQLQKQLNSIQSDLLELAALVVPKEKPSNS